ncbi:MAG TPA: DUF2244 domain-containing protein [Burkholderiales bacterium]|nr:DUF2244 domain-containing protein [Burkholderiales bacterium]
MSTPSHAFPGREFAFRDGLAEFSLTLKRNCSISPAGLLGVFAALSLASSAIGIGFAIAGAWPVLPFVGLEIAALGAAFVLYARRAGDYERIELARGRLTIEVVESERQVQYELDARRARVVLERNTGYGARVLVREAGKEVEIGRHLDALSRIEFAGELSRRLRN